MDVPGPHHVTAISNDPRANVEFPPDVLGLRPVKRTVNSDDTATGGPGFDRDESVAELGSGLALPPWLDDGRSGSALPELDAPAAEGN